MAGYMATAKRKDWETPQELFDKLNDEFHFDLDVCASSANAKCEDYFTEADNGLARSRSGRTAWCNPPYGKQIADWVKKASEENATTVMLLPSRTDTKWFHDYVYGKAEVRFIKGRVKFGGMQTAAPFASMLVVFRNENRSY